MALIVSILVTIAFAFTGEDLIFPYIAIFLATFTACYFTTYLTLEFLIFKELRNLYKHIGKVSGNSDDILDTMEDLPLRKMSQELFQYSEKKEKEIKKLKEVESFRRQFLADIAHELKNPVHTALGFIETLIDGAVDDLKVRDRFLSKTRKSLENLDYIVRDLISISHLETGEIKLDVEVIDIRELLSQHIIQLEELATANDVKLFFTPEVKQEKCYVQADSYRLGQVITNLVNNGINYAGKGAVIIIKLLEKDNKFCIEIVDDGIGIDPKHHDNIFNRFYRVDKSRSREHGGTGLGLSIVKHLVEAHDSKIKLDSKLGKGTKFYFSLAKAKLD